MTWMLILAACVAFALGIAFGMSLQWRRNKAYIKRLEAKVVDLQAKAAKAVADSWAPMFAEDHALENKELRARVRELEEWKRNSMRIIDKGEGKPIMTFDIDDYSDSDDWGEDTFDMDELQMRQTGAHE